MPKKNIGLYIGGPGYSYEKFELKLNQISNHFDEILKKLNLTTRDGREVTIELFVEASNPEEIQAYAKRISKDPAIYEIRLSAGLSYHLWLASRAFASDAKYLNWIDKIQLLNKKLRKIGRKEFLADYAYFLASYLVLLHEISHVILGHCDYIQDKMGLNELHEYEDEQNRTTDEQRSIRLALESEADRQAGEFLTAFSELSLGETGLGIDIRFPSRKHVYEFYTYGVTLVFVLLQQLDQRKAINHPKPNVRQYIVISALPKYFNMYKPEQLNIVPEHAILTMVEAGKKTGLIEAGDPVKVMQNAFALASVVDPVVTEINIREEYQLTFGLRM